MTYWTTHREVSKLQLQSARYALVAEAHIIDTLTDVGKSMAKRQPPLSQPSVSAKYKTLQANSRKCSVAIPVPTDPRSGLNQTLDFPKRVRNGKVTLPSSFVVASRRCHKCLG